MNHFPFRKLWNSQKGQSLTEIIHWGACFFAITYPQCTCYAPAYFQMCMSCMFAIKSQLFDTWSMSIFRTCLTIRLSIDYILWDSYPLPFFQLELTKKTYPFVRGGPPAVGAVDSCLKPTESQYVAHRLGPDSLFFVRERMGPPRLRSVAS